MTLMTQHRDEPDRWRLRLRSRAGRAVIAGAAAITLIGGVTSFSPASSASAAEGNAATEVLEQISIPDADDVRGSITLPSTLDGADVEWTSSDPAVVSDRPQGDIPAGVVVRPAAGSEPVPITMTACTVIDDQSGCRDIDLTIRPSVGDLAEFTGYGMVTFQNSESEKIYGASSVGNNALSWEAINDGEPIFTSAEGSTGLRDPSIVRSPEGDKFYLVATDLWTQDPNFKGWGWAQTGGSQSIEVWESTDLKNWSNQRHVKVNNSPETGMTFAPEAIWDPEIEAYVVYWSSAIYADGTYYTEDLDDPNRRDTDAMAWGRNVTYYATTRDFVTFSDSKVMYDRGGSSGGAWNYGYGNLDPVISYNPDDGYYYRVVQDRWDKIFERLYPDCAQTTTDLYIERSRSILADAKDWELLGGCLTINAINGAGLGTASYNEGANVVQTNPADVNGDGFYMMADGGWTATDGTRHPGLQPYFATDISSGTFAAITEGWNPPTLAGARGPRAAHGNVLALTAAEHAAFRGAELDSISVEALPEKTSYAYGEDLDTSGLVVQANYADDSEGVALAEGFGGYNVSGYDPHAFGDQEVTVSFTVLGVTETATFTVTVAADTTRPVVNLESPTMAGPHQELNISVSATDETALARIVANVYQDGKLVKSTQSAADGAKTATHEALVSLPDGAYTIRYNAQDVAGNISRTSEFAVTLDSTSPTVTIKNASGKPGGKDSYRVVSFKLFDAGKIDTLTLNGVVKNLTDNTWSDLNGVKPGRFGAVSGANTLVVFDVAGNSETVEFTLK